MRREVATKEVRVPLLDEAAVKKLVSFRDQIIYRTRAGTEKSARVAGWQKSEDGKRDFLVLFGAGGDYPVPLSCVIAKVS